MVTSKYWPSPYSLSASVEFPLLLNTQHHWYHTLWNKLKDKRETSTQSFTINTMILPYNHPAIWLGYYDWKIHFFFFILWFQVLWNSYIHYFIFPDIHVQCTAKQFNESPCSQLACYFSLLEHCTGITEVRAH